MSGRQKAGVAMTIFGYLVYGIMGLLALGSMFNGCSALIRGSVVEFIFSVGLAVIIGGVGQFVAALILAGSAAVSGDN